MINPKSKENRELALIGLKRCSKCQETKELSKFSRRGTTWDGLRSTCKDCDKIVHAAYRSVPVNRENEQDYKQSYRQQNKQKEAEYTREWKERNSSILPSLQRKWRQTNKEQRAIKARARTTRWVKDNPERHRMNGRNYRARSANAEGSHTFEQEQMLLAAFGGICPSCRSESKLALDHVIPLNQGGTHYIDNLQGLCKLCNSTKQDRVIVDYRPKQIRYWAFAEMSFVYLDIQQ